jgi:phosphohistidine phosphatase
LHRLGVKLTRIVSSPLPRAFRTAEIVAEALGSTGLIEVADELRAGRDAASIREWLKTRQESRLMLVGHNPSLSDLLSLLLTGNELQRPICELHKGGIAALQAEPGEPYQVDWIARPRLFRL